MVSNKSKSLWNKRGSERALSAIFFYFKSSFKLDQLNFLFLKHFNPELMRTLETKFEHTAKKTAGIFPKALCEITDKFERSKFELMWSNRILGKKTFVLKSS